MASSGNFCTLNPLAQLGGSTDASTRAGSMSNGNLKYVNLTGNTAVGTFGVTSGKWYFEVYVSSFNSDNGMTIGWANDLFNLDAELGYNSPSSPSGAQGFGLYSQNQTLIYGPGNGSSTYNKSYGSGTPSDGDIMRIWLDADNGKFWGGLNGTIHNSGDPSAGTNWGFGTGGSPHNIAISSRTLYPAIGNWSAADATVIFNFGQDSTFQGAVSAGGNADGNGFGDFKYDPDGFLALCTANLPISDDIDPAQTDDEYPAKNFNVVTWTGNRTDDRAITGVGFAPDLVWIKQRTSFGNPNILTDTVRGATKRIESNADIAEGTDSDGLKSFTSDGFTLGTNDKYNWDSPHTYLAWCWKGGGTPTATNSASAGATPTSGSVKIDGSNLGSALAGSIPATKLSANTKGGFSIITYTGTGSNATIAHGLSAKPDFILTKRLNSSQTWGVYHSGLGATKYLALNSTAVAGTSSSFWQDTEPTTSVISLGTEGRVNGNSQTYVAYAWHNVEGMQKFGTFIGNNTDNDGPFCYLGFRPRLLAIKGATEAYSWFVFDSARNTHNLVDKHLRWDSNDTEATEPTGARKVDFLSNGFKVMADEASLNGSGDTYVYMAWGDVPFKYNNTF